MEDYIWPEITADTSLEKVKEIHKRIWDYVIMNGEKPDTPYVHNCVLCEYAGCVCYAKRMQEHHSICLECAAKWTTKWCGSFDGGLYLNWGSEKSNGILKKSQRICHTNQRYSF